MQCDFHQICFTVAAPKYTCPMCSVCVQTTRYIEEEEELCTCQHHVSPSCGISNAVPCQLCPDQMSSALGLCSKHLLRSLHIGYASELSNSEVDLGAD